MQSGLTENYLLLTWNKCAIIKGQCA